MERLGNISLHKIARTLGEAILFESFSTKEQMWAATGSQTWHSTIWFKFLYFYTLHICTHERPLQKRKGR